MAETKNKSKLEPLSEWDMDSMWMSYRYCIGRHTIASHMRAGDIATHCYGRLTPERSVFTAYDMNRSIEDSMRFLTPNWYFPIGNQNRIYTSAIDIYCEFLEDFDIKSKEDLLKYRDIHIINTDNSRGYKFETVTWEEYLKSNPDTKDKPRDPEYFFVHDYEDLFVWNDLVHLFDLEHHYKVELINGTIEEVFETWTTASNEEGYRIPMKYKKIIVPVDKFSIHHTTWIPEEYIKRRIE